MVAHTHISIRFVDRDMFMRYRGGGIGHKYMREVEEKYENMSLERVHGDSQPKASQKNTDIHGTRSGGEGFNTPNPPAESTDGNQSDGTSDDVDGGGPETRDGDSADGDESEDEGYMPPETGDSDDDCESTDSAEDSDEFGSDGSDESYGLADL